MGTEGPPQDKPTQQEQVSKLDTLWSKAKEEMIAARKKKFDHMTPERLQKYADDNMEDLLEMVRMVTDVPENISGGKAKEKERMIPLFTTVDVSPEIAGAIADELLADQK